MKKIIFFFLLLIIDVTFSQIVKGPKVGSVPNGVSVSTGTFKFEPSEDEIVKIPELPNTELPLLTDPENLMPPLAPEGSNYIEDNSAIGVSRPVVLKNFQGIPDQGGFPPDPILAVGPNHVMALVNSSFRIYDKNGTILKSISAQTWFNSIAPASSPNDPQIIYDHFANRWVMLWMTYPTATDHYHMFSVSDDENPMGVWYNWKTPSHFVGDSTIGSWGDYPALGYDDKAIYLTSRQFSFGGSYRYGKLRIVPKEQLYQNIAGPIMWYDFWDFRDPQNTSTAPDNVRPYSAYDSLTSAYMMNSSPFGTGTYFTLWKISNPVTSPNITAINIPVTQYSSPPNANQLGGSTVLIESGGSKLRANVIYRDSSLWAIHSIGSGVGNAYSSIRYVKINPYTNTTLEDVAMGKQGFWHFYPAIAVDKNKNLIIGYSRSGLTEYIGAYVSGRNSNDGIGLSQSVLVKNGEANYVKSDGSRNRWGDYNGAALDPFDSSAVWTLTEYAKFPANTWGTWIGKIKMGPFSGVVASVSNSQLQFGPIQVGNESNDLDIKIGNDGIDSLEISNATLPTANYLISGLQNFPIKVSYYDSLLLNVKFIPSAVGNLNDSIILHTNNSENPDIVIHLFGKGYTIAPAEKGILYATSGISDGGRLLKINPLTGGFTPIGETGFNEIVSCRVHPTTHELIGLTKSGSNYFIVRINSDLGDAYVLDTVFIANLKGMEFRNDGALLVASQTGSIYEVDIYNVDPMEVTMSNIPIAGLAINPITNQLWASVRPAITGKDRIYKIALPFGDTIRVGSTGTGMITTDIIFDAKGNLYGLVGSGTQQNKLIKIDTSNAVGTVVGSLGISSVLSLALYADTVALSVNEITNLPNRFSLKQNYPNPFNPKTKIKYEIAKSGFVNLKVFDVLGREIKTLVNENQNAGYYEIDFDANNLNSGIYFYKLTTNNFSEMKKMILVK